MKTSYIGFGGEQLKDQPDVSEGQPYFCPECNAVCYSAYGTDMETSEKVGILTFIHCSPCDKSWLIGVAGKYIGNVKPAVSGEVEL